MLVKPSYVTTYCVGKPSTPAYVQTNICYLNFSGFALVCMSVVMVLMSYGGVLDVTGAVSAVWSGVFKYRTCSEKHDLVFLKVHKTGSSTMANIIERFGFQRKLNFALPNKTQGEVRYNYIGRIGETLNETRIQPSQKNAKLYNLLYNHVIYNWKSFNVIFPRRRTTYVTLLRHPLSQFKSSLLYFRNSAIYTAATENLTQYLENIRQHEPSNPYISFTDNRQSLDLGLPSHKVRDEGFITRYIEMLDKAFDLMLIMDYFDESLVMLRRKMCWSMKDILYIRSNKAYRHFDFVFGEYEKSLLKDWSLADNLLYDHFYTKFHFHLKKDPNIMEEAHWFKLALDKTQTFCSGNSTESKTRIEQSPWNPPFYVTSLDCAFMKLGELEFLNMMLDGI